MKTFEIEANLGRGEDKKGSVTVSKDLGENLDELSKQHGADVVYAHAKASIVVALQGFLRSKMTSAKNPVTDPKALQALADDWKPTVRTPGKPAAEKVKEQIGKMTPEERKALLAQLQEETKASAQQTQASRPRR